MPAIARVGDKVLSPNGTGYHCTQPMETAVGEGNTHNVKLNGMLVVVEGCKVAPHPLPGCSTIDEQVLSTFSNTIKIGGLRVGRIGDMMGDNIIVQGSTNGFAGG